MRACGTAEFQAGEPLADLEADLVLAQLMDSALPTGAFSHSLGFETLVAEGTVRDTASFGVWLRGYVRHQLTYTDAVAVRLCVRAGTATRLAEVASTIAAATVPEETRAAGRTMGARLLELANQVAPSPMLSQYAQLMSEYPQASAPVHPAVVWGAVARGLHVSEDAAVVRHLFGAVLALTQNAVRGIPIGQDAGQRLVAQARGWVREAAVESAYLGEEDVGTVAPGLEIAQLKHAQMRARMFMS